MRPSGEASVTWRGPSSGGSLEVVLCAAPRSREEGWSWPSVWSSAVTAHGTSPTNRARPTSPRSPCPCSRGSPPGRSSVSTTTAVWALDGGSDCAAAHSAWACPGTSSPPTGSSWRPTSPTTNSSSSVSAGARSPPAVSRDWCVTAASCGGSTPTGFRRPGPCTGTGSSNRRARRPRCSAAPMRARRRSVSSECGTRSVPSVSPFPAPRGCSPRRTGSTAAGRSTTPS